MPGRGVVAAVPPKPRPVAPTNVVPTFSAVSPVGGGGAFPSMPGTGGGFGAPAPAAPPSAPPPLTNTAQTNPAMQAWLDRVGAAHTTAAGAGADPLMAEQVDNLRSRMSSDTTARAIQRAQLANKTGAAGQKRALSRMMSRNSAAPGGAETKLGMRIDDAAERRSAAQAADITQGAETRLDNLTIGGQGIMTGPAQYRLQQQAIANGLLGLGASTAGNIAQQGLAQQGLGLNQWQAYDASQRGWSNDARAAESDRLGQMMAIWRLMNPNAAA